MDSMDNNKCTICNVPVDDIHKSSDLHRFNFLLFEWNNYRKSLVKNRNGINITQKLINANVPPEKCDFTERKGLYNIQVTSLEFKKFKDVVTVEFTIENEMKKDGIHLLSANILHPFYDYRQILNNSYLFEPKDKHSFEVPFELKAAYIGNYEVPIAFSFQTANNPIYSFTICRQVVVTVSDLSIPKEEWKKNPFKSVRWSNIRVIVPPSDEPYRINNYPIPSKYETVLKSGLIDHEHFKDHDKAALNYIRNVLDSEFQKTGTFQPGFPTQSNYKDFYHFVLWLDEMGQSLMLQRYNMSGVRMKVIGDSLELEVPGLAEKRPSLLPGDSVMIRLQKHPVAYRGVVDKVNNETILIKNVHLRLVHTIIENENVELEVAFELNRLSYERMHAGIDNCVHRGMLRTLFPESHLANRNSTKNLVINNFFNRSILSNEEQKTAVLNILNCTSQYAPYIVFGPPGTGKTITIVEAILQIKENLRAKILVCAPANAACDMLTSKLICYCNKNELIRVHTETREWSTVPEDVKGYSNHDGRNYTRMHATKLNKYSIVITTLILIGKYNNDYCPDYVFIDEAAQAKETEADVAIGLMAPGKQLILAGDPKQLGPLCASKAAAKLKLEISLLERLMLTNDLYKNEDSNYITMLKLNYRAHPTVLQIPNELFYQNKLKAVNPEPLNDPIAKICIYSKIIKSQNEPGVPVEFCVVNAKEQRQGKSPSYFNVAEMQMVIKYIKTLLELNHVKVVQTDIGVVTPYIRQVHQLKSRLKSMHYTDVEVGTTEVFQGREKRIIILSTVRGQQSLLLFDKKYNLGFVSNEKRMNVALTRAKSKLIVIGCPTVLGTNKNWTRYIEFCEKENSYFGIAYHRRTKKVQDEIVKRFNNVKKN